MDPFSLDGRTALVTGGNRGLGLAFVRGLAEAGARVVFCGRDTVANDAAVALLATEGHDVSAVAADLTDDEAARATIEEAVSRLGRLDVLVNNAGVCYHADSWSVPDVEYHAVMDLNVRAVWTCSVAASRVMATQGGGSIVNVGSISALIVNRPQWQAAYNASKAAVHQLTKSFAAEWAPHHIRVNALAPGYVKTEMAPVDEPRFRRMWIEDAPQQRYATPEEIAPSVVYLASDAASFVTGSVLVIDGGYTVH